jgi:hypothetical protein
MRDRHQDPEKIGIGRGTALRGKERPPIPTARGRVTMTLAINDTAPDFEAETTEGRIRLHDWIRDNWVVLFSHRIVPQPRT